MDLDHYPLLWTRDSKLFFTLHTDINDYLKMQASRRSASQSIRTPLERIDPKE